MKVQLDAVGIVVNDMARSLAFYRQLGVDVPADADEQPHVEVVLPGGMRLLFDTEETIRSFDPDWQAPDHGHRVGLAFLIDSPSELDSLYETLMASGHHGHKAPWDAFWGQRYAMLHDPDGNAVDLFSPSS
jgi:catechol 2,3-dioxygenase-like lactoylglutathione lyase family enzyme